MMDKNLDVITYAVSLIAKAVIMASTAKYQGLSAQNASVDLPEAHHRNIPNPPIKRTSSMRILPPKLKCIRACAPALPVINSVMDAAFLPCYSSRHLEILCTRTRHFEWRGVRVFNIDCPKYSHRIHT